MPYAVQPACVRIPCEGRTAPAHRSTPAVSLPTSCYRVLVVLPGGPDADGNRDTPARTLPPRRQPARRRRPRLVPIADTVDHVTPTGAATCRPQAPTPADEHADADGHPDQDAPRHGHGDRDEYPDSDADRYAHRDTDGDADGYPHLHADGDADRYGDGNGHADSDTHRDGHAHRDADGYADQYGDRDTNRDPHLHADGDPGRQRTTAAATDAAHTPTARRRPAPLGVPA